MLDRKLLHLIDNIPLKLFFVVLSQWMGQIAGVVFVFSIAYFIGDLLNENLIRWQYVSVILLSTLLVRIICSRISGLMSHNLAESVKKTLRNKIFNKIFEIGPGYSYKLSYSNITQLTTDGVEQLQVYFANFLPQFFFSIISPLTLFFALCLVNLKTALILLVCVPIIPLLIVGIMRFAKRTLSKYLGSYINLGESFLENLYGLTTLKIFEADEYKNNQMNEKAESFRNITMKVLTMQLNSITLMDIVAFGGAAIGISVGLIEYFHGRIDIVGMIIIILLASEFFVPMRILGSFFHIAMNGVASSVKIFEILNDETKSADELIDMNENDRTIVFNRLSFSYDKKRTVLENINFKIENRGMFAFVGKSGCGKSTIASLISGVLLDYEGNLLIGEKESKQISYTSRLKNICLVSTNSYIFPGTIRDNLLIASPSSSDRDLLNVLNDVSMLEFVNSQNGLDTLLVEGGTNLSGGQQQRLAIARSLLYNANVYIFDEALSNVDVESEDVILQRIKKLAKDRIVIFISHRLSNVVNADNVYFMQKGKIVEEGTHNKLIAMNGSYADLFNYQISLEDYGK